MKKILPIVSLVIICALAITTIVLALVPKSYAVDFEKPDYIVAYVNGKSETFDTSNEYSEEIYNTILTKFNEAFKESAINSLLQGRAGEKCEVEYRETNTSPSTTSSTKVYLKFCYNAAEEEVIKADGSTYKFNSLIVEIPEADSLAEVKVGMMPSGKNYYNYYYISLANLSEVYTYLTELELA